ncbi:MAG: DUF4268 domain-containing protein [Planctomycetota bacterium]|nr:DUF4268 domain-containing protein [Planctomycetota bacterium]
MTSSFCRPLLVRADGTSATLAPIPLSQKDGWNYSEEWLQRLLYLHPEILPIAEIDNSYSGPIPLCMEMDTPAGPIDAVYITPSGRLILLEAKLWRNPEARRKVIGQILDYAKEISQWSYSRLDEAVRQARKNASPEVPFPGIEKLVAEHVSGLVEHRFSDAVTKSMGRGDFLLLIAGDGIREGVGAITQFLDRSGAMHFTFGLVECAIYEGPEGGHFVQPRVLAQTTLIPRTIFLLGDNRISEQEPVPEEDLGVPGVSAELQESRARYQQFWREFLDLLQVEEQQPVSKPATSTNQYFSMPPGSNGWVSAYLQQSKGRAGVYLTFGKGTIGDRLFSALAADRAEIDAALGVAVEWTSAEGGRGTVLASKSFPGILLDDSRKPAQVWLADVVPRFVSVFRPRIDALLRTRQV